MLEGATALAESGVLSALPADIHAFVADDGLCFILHSSQFDSKWAYLTYHCSREVDWEDETSVGWFPFIS